MLQKMKGENDASQERIWPLSVRRTTRSSLCEGQPKPLTEQQTASIVDTRTAEQIEKARMPRFSTVNANAGADQSGNLTFTGRGRFFCRSRNSSPCRCRANICTSGTARKARPISVS